MTCGVAAQDGTGQTVGDLARPVPAVAEVLTVPGLWTELRDVEEHCALVVNEYGSVAGLVTMEDAVEEIFGEVLDEFDVEEDPVTVDQQRVSVRGDVLLDVLRDRFGIPAPDDVDTVGGLLWHELGRRPVVGDEVPVGPAGVVVRVDRVDGTAVARASFDLPDGAR